MKVERLTINGLKYKVCTKCGIAKPSDLRYFRPCKTSSDGLNSFCKSCSTTGWVDSGKFRIFDLLVVDKQITRDTYQYSASEYKRTIDTIKEQYRRNGIIR